MASKGFYSGGVVHLNADRLSEGGFTYTGIHEVVHHLKSINTEGYKAIESFVKNYYKEKGADLDSEVAKTQAYYKSKGVELTPEEAMEEIVCNTLSDIATDEDALSAFLGLDTKSHNKFLEVIKTLVRKLKEWANKFLKNTEYHSIVMNDADTLLSLAKQLRAELTKTKQKNNTAENSGVKYSIKNTSEITLKEQLSLFYNNKLKSSDALYFGTTPSILEKSGLSELPLALGQNDFKKSTNVKHNIPRRVLKNLNNSLSEPILSFAFENRVGVLTSDIDADGKPVLVAIEKSVMMDREPVNVIRSIYGLDNPKNWIKNQIEADKVFVFYNEKRANSFLQTYGYKASVEEGIRLLGESLTQDTDVVKAHSAESIDEQYLLAAESGDTKTAQRLVDETAEDAMKDSKIRDENGKLAKVYHGSESDDFFEFDKARRGQTDTVSGKDNKKGGLFETTNIIILSYKTQNCQRK